MITTYLTCYSNLLHNKVANYVAMLTLLLVIVTRCLIKSQLSQLATILGTCKKAQGAINTQIYSSQYTKINAEILLASVSK